MANSKDTISVTNKSCDADALARSRFCTPINCDDTTAPPVASAAKILISKMLIISTREIPDTAASPTDETMIVSTIPTVTASACSMMSGIISFLSAWFVNSG